MEDYYMVEEIAWGAERGKSFHLCLTSFCEISQDLVGWFLFVWWVVLCFCLCWFAFFGMVLWKFCTQLAPAHFKFPVVDRLCFALARQCRKKKTRSPTFCLAARLFCGMLHPFPPANLSTSAGKDHQSSPPFRLSHWIYQVWSSFAYCVVFSASNTC